MGSELKSRVESDKSQDLQALTFNSVSLTGASLATNSAGWLEVAWILSEVKRCEVDVWEEDALVGELTMFEDKHVFKWVHLVHLSNG